MDIISSWMCEEGEGGVTYQNQPNEYYWNYYSYDRTDIGD